MEVAHCGLLVQQDDLELGGGVGVVGDVGVVGGGGLRPEASVQCYALQPSSHIGLRNPAPKHALKVHNEVKSHLVNIVCVYENDVFAPFRFFHATKVQNIIKNRKTKRNKKTKNRALLLGAR
jgi:hypothetical protein